MRRYRKETGIGISELLRRLVDDFLKDWNKRNDTGTQDSTQPNN